MNLSQWKAALGKVGIKDGDSEEEKIMKSSLTVLAVPFAALGLLWSSLYFYNGLYLSGAIPFSYSILSFLTLIHFGITKRYYFFRNSQLFLILILPFLLQASLGGFIGSSAVIIWALVSPVGALVFFKTKNSVKWFVAYFMLLIMAWLFNAYFKASFSTSVSEDFINGIFILNIAGVSALIFAVQYVYVNRQTELKAAIESQNEKLKEMDVLKTRFFANISHEFRTPLTIILGLANKHIEKTKDQKVRVDHLTIKSNANRLLELINQLLDIAKLESGEERLQLREDDIVTYVKRNYAVFESLALSRKQLLLFNGKKFSSSTTDAPIIAYFDHEKLQKVLSNLLSNAVKFTPEEGIIDVAIKQDETLRIEVSNTGIEIDATALPHLFDRFYQVNAESTREHEGTGIGLALVKELVEVHQGTVSVVSAHGKTTFAVTLPLAYDDDHKAVTEDHQTPELVKPDHILQQEVVDAPEDTEANELLVLIVEDNADLRKLIRSILEDNYRIMEASDGLEGLQMATEHVPDLIISDVMMPKMDGLQLCAEIKNHQKTAHVPVVLLTAKASKEHKIEGLQQGADDYLVKPFEREELIARINNLIDMRKKLQEHYQDTIWSRPVMEKKKDINDQFLNHVKEITETNLDNNLFGVDDLAKEVGMSRSQIHRKLKALTNKSATTYVKSYRLHRAAELLVDSEDTVSEIAYRVGFSSQTYFSSSFSELFDQSPTEYRKIHEQ